MTNWLRNNIGTVVTQVVGVTLMSLVFMLARQQLDGYVRKEDWIARNVEIDHRFDRMEQNISGNLKRLEDTLVGNTAQFVTSVRWAERNAVIDDRFEKLEKYVQEGRVERMVFQKEVLDRLTRIEERLAAHMTKEGAKLDSPLGLPTVGGYKTP